MNPLLLLGDREDGDRDTEDSSLSCPISRERGGRTAWMEGRVQGNDYAKVDDDDTDGDD